MEDKNTHEIILQKALELFSAKGFAAVSMRNIADAVGIRASSIYHHFKGKQELFDELIERANIIKEAMRESFMKVFEKVEEIEPAAFVLSGVSFLTGFLRNPQVAPLLNVLEAERYHNEKAEQAWRDLFMREPMEHELKVFSIMKEKGMLLDEDIDALTAEYQAMITFAYFSDDIEQLKKQLNRFYIRTVKQK